MSGVHSGRPQEQSFCPSDIQSIGVKTDADKHPLTTSARTIGHPISRPDRTDDDGAAIPARIPRFGCPGLFFRDEDVSGTAAFCMLDELHAC